MKFLLLFLFTVNANATFTPIGTAPINYYAVGVLGKGELLTSNGVSNGTQAICVDDEILVWDSTAVAGVKCEAKPIGVETLACADDEIIVYDSTEANGFKCEAKPTGGAGKKCQAKFQTTNATGEVAGVRFSNLVVGEKYSVKYLVSGTAGIKRASIYVNGSTVDANIVGQLRWSSTSVNNNFLTTRIFEITQANSDVRLVNLSGQSNGSTAPWFATWAEICQEPASTELVTTF